MIKKISTLCLLFCLMFGALSDIMAQDLKSKSPKKELLMSEDDLIKSLTEIAIAVQEMAKNNNKEVEDLDLSYLANFYLNNSNTKEKYNEAQENSNSRLDRIEDMLGDLIMVVGESNKGKKVVIERNRRVPTAAAKSEDPNQNNLLEGFQRQIILMQEQINVLTTANADSTYNSNFKNVLALMSSLQLTIEEQNKILKEQNDYFNKKKEAELQSEFAVESNPNSKITSLERRQKELEEEINELKMAAIERESSGKQELVLQTKFLEVQEPKTEKNVPEKQELVPEKEIEVKTDIETVKEASKKTEAEVTREVSEKVEQTKTPAEKNEKKQVFFDFDSFKLSHEAKNLLEEVNVEMQNDATTIATILGLSSPEGNAAYNKRLAQKRSQSVCDYLVAKGIAKERIKVSTASIDLDSDVRAYGRRVDINLSVK